MRINPAQVAKLFKNIPGQTVKGGSKFTKYGFSIVVPENAVRCDDIVRGVGKKGYFKVLSFRDAEDNLIQRCTRYRNKNEYTDVITDLDMSTGIVNRKKKTINGIINGKRNIEQIEYSSMLPAKRTDGKFIFEKQSMTLTSNGDFGSHELFQPYKQPIGISYKYNWDGHPVSIKYKNTLGKTMDMTERELSLLPVTNGRYYFVEQNEQTILGIKDFTTGRVNEKVNMAQNIFEREYGIKKGLLPRAKAVKEEELYMVKATGKTPSELAQERNGMHIAGEATPDGQIHISKDVEGGTDLYRICDNMSHEMRHEADRIKAYSGGPDAAEEGLRRSGKSVAEKLDELGEEVNYYNIEKFADKCIKVNGLYKKGTPEYEEAVDIFRMFNEVKTARYIEDAASHDAMEIEERAINAQLQYRNLLEQISAKVGQFFVQFIG